jgi:hypothetical protein
MDRMNRIKAKGKRRKVEVKEGVMIGAVSPFAFYIFTFAFFILSILSIPV